MKLKLKIAVAALVNLCTLSKESSGFKDTCFLAIERTKDCKLKILPAYFVTTNTSVFLSILTLFTFSYPKKSKLTPASAGRHFQRQLMYNSELSSQNKQNLSENTTLEGYCDINMECDMYRV